MNLNNQKNLINNKQYIDKINIIRTNYIYIIYIYTNIFNFNLHYILINITNIKIVKQDCIKILLKFNFKYTYINHLTISYIYYNVKKKTSKKKKFKYIKNLKYNQNIKIHNNTNILEDLYVQNLFIQPQIICLNFTILQNSIIVNGINVNTSKIVLNTSTAQIGFSHLKNNLMYALESLIEYCMDYVLLNNYKNIIIKFKINPFFMHISYILHIFQDLFLKQQNNLKNIKQDIDSIDDFLIKSNFTNTDFKSSLNIYFNINRMKIFNGCKLKKEKYCKIRKKQQKIKNSSNFFWNDFDLVDF